MSDVEDKVPAAMSSGKSEFRTVSSPSQDLLNELKALDLPPEAMEYLEGRRAELPCNTALEAGKKIVTGVGLDKLLDDTIDKNFDPI